MKFDIRRLETTESTNDDARKAAETGTAEGLAIWALEQKSGRGRRGRPWQSPPGNLYCSVLLRPELEVKNFGFYSFIVALAISDVVRGLLPDAIVELKWPNDVLVGGKKISGILLESGTTQGQGWLVIGMGVNVRHFPENPLYPVTSLMAEGIEPPPLEDMLQLLLRTLGNWCDILKNLGFPPVRAAWLDRARKGKMLARLPDQEIAGTFGDLDNQGNLRLILPDGTERCITTGDVFL
jgi:BirA family biotin operon repressor/biotin-[acetyl-CoA-carboxylase] ligase